MNDEYYDDEIRDTFRGQVESIIDMGGRSDNQKSNISKKGPNILDKLKSIS